MYKKILLLLLFACFLKTTPAFASIGVGINNGKIVINNQLKPGGVYQLPDVNVFNTGTEVTDYALSVKYNQAQKELKPDASWVHFSPERFTLPARGIQKVKVSLALPLNTQPGTYFSYIDAHPVVGTVPGVTTVGIAAGAKLYFTVVAANQFTAFYYRLLTLMQAYAPWSYLVIALLLTLLLSFIFSKKFKLNIGVQKK